MISDYVLVDQVKHMISDYVLVDQVKHMISDYVLVDQEYKKVIILESIEMYAIVDQEVNIVLDEQMKLRK
jgi:hypothetical protein